MNRYLSTLLGALLTSAAADAQLRVVAYNTLDKPVGAFEESQIDTIFSAIAATERNGIAKRVDIVALQEQARSFTQDTIQSIANRLNAIHGVSSYTAFSIASGNDAIGYVYDSSTLNFQTAEAIDTEPRDTPLSWFIPAGYSSGADLFLYNVHLKAGGSTSDVNRRATAASIIRNDADSLAGALDQANFIYLGDTNFGSSNELGYRLMTNPGFAEAFDPIDLPSWPNAGVSEHLTQSTRNGSLGDGGAGGGMDDRFDMQLVTADLLDGEGLSYIGPTATGLSGLEHSYQAFGNDGVSYNTQINNTFVGRSQSAAVLNALHDFSDHLPVIADYQLPAVLGVDVETIPTTLELGELFNLEVTVTNDADVVAAAGADELDYTLMTTGAASGAGSGILDALAAGDTFQLTLDTSLLGPQTGVLTVSTDSQAAANALFELPISFEVVAPALAGDYNSNGVVDAADYTVWRDGASPDPTLAGYSLWAGNFGATSAVAVPEPAGLGLLSIVVGALACRMRTS